MATAGTATRLGSGTSSNDREQHIRRNLFGNPIISGETGGSGPNGGGAGNRLGFGINSAGGVLRASKNGLNGDREDRRRELSGDEIEEVEDAQVAPNKRIRMTDEVAEVPAAFFGQIVSMLEAFGTKGTVWYSSPEAEKKKDKSAFVLWKGRTKNDGTMTLSIMEENRTVREVIATEVSIAQQFKDIFDPNSASRIFELVGNGSNIQKAVFQTLTEQNENGSSSD
jgi:hypothetical protein